MILRTVFLNLFSLLICTLGYGQSITWLSWEEASEKMETEPKKIIVDVYTSWCTWCKKMDKSTFQNPRVVEHINKHYYAVKFDAEYRKPIVYKNKQYEFINNGKGGYHALAATILKGRMSYPSIVFLSEDMDVIQPLAGFQNAQTMYMLLHYFEGDYHKSMPWKSFTSQFKRKHQATRTSKPIDVQTVGNRPN